jgi:hypothetical protein
MPAQLPPPYPIPLGGGALSTLAAADEPTDTPTKAPGDDQAAARVAPPTGPGYTRVPRPTT